MSKPLFPFDVRLKVSFTGEHFDGVKRIEAENFVDAFVRFFEQDEARMSKRTLENLRTGGGITITNVITGEQKKSEDLPPFVTPPKMLQITERSIKLLAQIPFEDGKCWYCGKRGHHATICPVSEIRQAAGLEAWPPGLIQRREWTPAKKENV